MLAKAAVDADRSPASVRLLAVSKTKPVPLILEAAAAGQLEFGENQVQEGLEKIRSAGRADIVWHFIGHLQTNKTRAVAEHFAWVHSVDRLKIARRLSEQRPKSMPPLNICLQVNVDAESGKSGVSIDELPQLARDVVALPRIALRGLMCLPAIRSGFDAQREPFRVLRQLAESLADDGIETDTLSMGMTNVRIGTAVFGARD